MNRHNLILDILDSQKIILLEVLLSLKS